MMKGVTPSHGEQERSRSENSLQGAREAPGSRASQERDQFRDGTTGSE